MRSLKDLSINAKLNLLVTVAGGVAVLLACAAFAANDYRMIRAAKVRQITALADLLGANSTAALASRRGDETAELLRSLSGQPSVCFASLHDDRGEVLATYHTGAKSGPVPATAGPPGHRFLDGGLLEVTRPVVREGKTIGTVRLRATTGDLRAQWLQCVKIAGLVMVVALGGSFLLSRRLQRAISVPILRLAKAVQRISAGGDYSIRVKKAGNDELGTLYDQLNGMLDRIQHCEREMQETHHELETDVRQRTRQLSQTNLELGREVIERNRAEKELEAIHQRLVGAARQAGMAEVATGVLHNVGNVLNSVNVSATLVADRLRNSRLPDLGRAVEMLNDHVDGLAGFLTEDERGKLLPGFLTMLADHLHQERQVVLGELEALLKNIDHVKTIVAMQQSYAGVAGVVEAVSLVELVEDALKLNLPSLGKRGIEVVREYAELPEVRVEKQKLLQVLVNLISNSKDSLTESTHPDRKLTIRILPPEEERLCIEVTDNGTGIPADDLARIFSHGFTTKRHGHGFGLHASANAAKEMGGRLTAASDGPRRGATFTVELPFVPVEVAV